MPLTVTGPLPEAPESVEKVESKPEPTSLLAGLAERLADARRKLHIDLEVPRYREMLGFQVFARYRPMTMAEVQKAAKRQGDEPDSDVVVSFNAQLLANTCLGIYAVLPSGERVSLDPEQPSGKWLRFSDKRLTEVLPPREDPVTGEVMNGGSASENVRRLYWTDPDLNLAATALTDFSGHTSERADEDFSRGLRDDSDVELAARVSLAGIPAASFFAASSDERLFFTAVAIKRAELEAAQRKEEFEALGHIVARAVVKAFGGK